MKKNITKTLALIATLCGLNAFAATTPIVNVDWPMVTVTNTTNNAGGYNWNSKAATLKIPTATGLASGAKVKVKSFMLWSGGDSGTSYTYADTISLTADGTTYTTELYTANGTGGNNALLYTFPAGKEPTVAVGTTYDLSFTTRSGSWSGVRFRAAANGSGADGFFKVGSDSKYAPQMVLTAEVVNKQVVSWVGDFANNATKGPYTMTVDSQNATVSGGNAVLTKRTDKAYNGCKGVAIDWAEDTFPGKAMTVVVKYSGFTLSTLGGNTAFLSALWGSTSQEVLFNATSTQIKLAYGVTSTSAGTNNQAAKDYKLPDSGMFAVTFSETGSRVVVFTGSDGNWTSAVTLSSSAGTLAQIADFRGIKIGGSLSKTGSYHRPGMTVEGVAIYGADIAASDLTKLKFGDENIIGSREALWNLDLANNSVKGDYTMTNDGGTIANGRITTQKTGGTGAPKGVQVNWFNGSGTSALYGDEMTVLVKYSGFSMNSGRTALFSAIWGASKDAKETTVCRTNDGKILLAKEVTSSGWTESGSPLSSAYTMPTDGLMLITMSGANATASDNFTAVAFATRNQDGSYGAFSEIIKNTVMTYGNTSRFYGIKIGGTIGPQNHFYRPQMTVEAVAVIQGSITKDSAELPALVNALVRSKSGYKYAATVTEDKDWSALTWSPAKPEGGFPEGSIFTLTNAGSADVTTVTVDSAIHAEKVKVVGASKTLKLASAANLMTEKIEAGTSAKVLVAGTLPAGSLTVAGPGTVEFEDAQSFASGKGLTVDCTVTGGFTFASGSTLTFGSSGALVIPSGKVVDWQNGYVKAMFRALHDKTSGDGLLKINYGSGTQEVHASSDTTALVANVNIEYTGTGTMKYVGNITQAKDKFTVSAGKTVKFENGTLWPMRSELVVNGTVIAKYIKIGHDSSGNYPGKVTINNGGALKTQSVTFANAGGTAGGSNDSVLTVGGELEFTQNDTAAITKTSGAKYSVVLNGGTLKSTTSSWHTDPEIAIAISANTTISAAADTTITIAGALSGAGNVSITGAGEVILNNSANTDTGTYTVASGASLTLGTGRTQTIDGTSAGTITVTLTASEKADLDAGNSVNLISVTGESFAGMLKTVDITGATYEINDPTISGGKLVVTKKAGARMSPFNVTNPVSETWTAAGWTDSTTPTPLEVRPEDWDNKVSANVTVEAGQEKALTADRALTLGTLAINNAGTLAISTNGTYAITVDAIDDTASTGATTIGFDIGALPLTAGANTILATAGTGAYTIPAEKMLTVKSGTVSEANVSNSGTLNFLGGTASDPIIYDSNGGASKNTGNLTIAADSYMKMLSHNQTKVMTVSGAGAATSKFEIYDNDKAGQGMKDGTQFRYLTLVVKNFLNPKYLWVEQSGVLDETVVLQANSRTIFNNHDFTVGGLTGGGTVKAQQDARVLTIKPLADYEYTGTSDVTFTIAASDYTQTLSGAYTGALTVNEGGKVKLTGSANPSSIANAGTVTLKGIAALAGIANAGKVVFDVPANTTNFVAYAITGLGSIEIVGGGTVIFKESSGVTPNTTITETSGKALFAKTVDINNLGKYTPVAPYTTANVVLFDQGGNVINATVVGDHLEYTWDVEGKNCWWDYEFNGNVTSTGTDTTTMTAEGTKPYYNSTENPTALWVGHATHYRGVSDGYPYEFTAVLQGKMVNTEKHVEIGFGSTGNSGISVAIACGNPENEEVELIISQGFAVQKTVLMSVPNAYDADHLYAFVVKTVNEGGTDKTKVIVYLDGVEWDSYTFSSKILLAAGFQIGSVHNGVPTGYSKATTVNEKSFLNFLRVYNTVLSNEAMTKYAAKYPYKSTNGNASRTFAATTANWTADGAWTVTPYEGKEYTSNMPPAKALLTINATAAATVTMNLDEAATYEQLKVTSGSAITLKAGGTVIPTVTGLTSVGADLTVDYNAIGIGKLNVAGGKTLTFDFKGFPIEQFFKTTSYEVTGAVTLGEGAEVKAINLPSSAGREVTFGLNEYGHYALNITVDATIPFTYTINEGQATGSWKWNEQVVDEATVLAQSSATIKKAGTGTQQFVGKNKYTYVVDGGTLKFTNTVTDVTSTITINEGATFDMNGLIDSLYNVVLNGGTLANYGKTISFNKKQLTSITLTKDSSVATVSGGESDSGNFCFISAGYATNKLDLAGHTLTKKGDAQFVLVNTVVTNGTVVVEEGQLRINAPDTTVNHTVFTNATLTIKKDAELYVGRNSLTIGEITGEGGTIHVTSSRTLSPFTLNGTLNLEGSGNYGTITMANGFAAADIGTRLGYYTFAGSGYVKAQLSTEYHPGDKITLFNVAPNGTTMLSTLKDASGETIDSDLYTCEKGVVTFKKEASVGTTYYFTLNDAILAVPENGTVVLLTNVVAGASITKSIVIQGDTFEMTGSGFTVDEGKVLTIAGGFIGVNSLGAVGRYSLIGGKYKDTTWQVAGGYHYAQITEAVPSYGDYGYQVIVGSSGKTDEIVYPVSGDGTEGNYTGDLAFTKAELVQKGIISSVETSDAAVMKALNTEGANGNMAWQNVVLGLDNKTETAKPVPVPVQGTSNGQISLKLGSNVKVDTALGAKVTYKVKTRTGSEWTTLSTEYAHGDTATVDLPDTGVKYYMFDVIVTPAK